MGWKVIPDVDIHKIARTTLDVHASGSNIRSMREK
jgi:hypothetical protein